MEDGSWTLPSDIHFQQLPLTLMNSKIKLLYTHAFGINNFPPPASDFLPTFSNPD